MECVEIVSNVQFLSRAQIVKIILRGTPIMSETDTHKPGLKDKITGFGQKIIGEIEELAGVVNADPLAQAEGEFNVEVGTIREGLEKYENEEK